MAGKIFVNYRRDDERAMAARVRDRLAGVFGASNVFMDVDNLMAGQRFDRELEKALAVTDIFLAVIGPRWLDLLKERQATGERDYVCEEISGALKRGVVVIPVLIEHAQLPRGDALPEDMRELVLHQKHSVTHEQFRRDIAALVEAIRFARQPKRSGGGLGLPEVPWSWVTLTAIVLLLGGWIGAHTLGYPVWWPFEKPVATLEPSQAELTEAARKSVLTEEAKKADVRPASTADFLQRPAWKAMQREFPEWFQAREKEAEALAAQGKSKSEIISSYINAFVTLRRQNAGAALVAATEFHRAIASAFLDNLRTLAQRNIDLCYNFISKGEAADTTIVVLQDADKSSTVEAQLVAIIDAIAAGRKSPASHAKPQKADYDALASELSRMGWSNADLNLFADPKALSSAPKDKVCSMVQDWFAAHLAITDTGTQERLLFETLGPVVSG